MIIESTSAPALARIHAVLAEHFDNLPEEEVFLGQVVADQEHVVASPDFSTIVTATQPHPEVLLIERIMGPGATLLRDAVDHWTTEMPEVEVVLATGTDLKALGFAGFRILDISPTDDNDLVCMATDEQVVPAADLRGVFPTTSETIDTMEIAF